MAEESLPHRTVAYRFPKVPDFTDPEYEKSNPEHFILARDQRMREYHVNYVYMLRLQQTLRLCILQSGINSKRECHDLGAEYMRRISCPNYSCPDVRTSKRKDLVQRVLHWIHSFLVSHFSGFSCPLRRWQSFCLPDNCVQRVCHKCQRKVLSQLCLTTNSQSSQLVSEHHIFTS